MSSSWLEVLVPIVRRAGGLAYKNIPHGRATAHKKGRGDWVTETDKQIEELIVNELQRYFPEHGFLGEEYGRQGDADHCWVIDPLDGTTNYVHRYPQTVISVAFCHKGRPTVAAVYDFIRDEMYTAAAGDGAYVNDERLRVSGQISFYDSLFIASGQIGDGGLWPFVTGLIKNTEGMRRTGSTVIDLAWLAAGRVDAVICGPVNFWDVAAGGLLLREAGGLICDVNDRRDFVFGERTDTFVAATPKIFTRFFTETKAFLKNGGGAGKEKNDGPT